MGKWCCAGPRPACSTPSDPSAASRATSSYPNSSPPSSDTPTPAPNASVPPHRVTMDRHRNSTQLGTRSYNGLQVWGSYASALLIQSPFVPKGYVAVVASGGPDSDNNPVGMRQHSNPSYQGLRHIPGHWAGYPLQDSFFARGFGVGVRHRGAAVVTQIKVAGGYVSPVIPV